MKKSWKYLVLMTLVLMFFACKRKTNDFISGERTYLNYMNTDKIIAVQAGDVYGDIARHTFNAKEQPEFLAISDMLEALRLGRVDAVLMSHSYIRQLQDSGMYPDLEFLWIPKDVYVNAAANIFHTMELRDKFNAWLQGIQADGTFDKIVNRWIGVPLPNETEIPQFVFPGHNGILKVADTGNYPPLIYFDAKNNPVGFDVEIISLFAQHLGMVPEFAMMSYEGIVPYILSGKADMSSCTLTVTDEREEGMIFGEPTVITQAVLIVPRGRKENQDFNDFRGQKIGVITGALTENTTLKIGGVPIFYNDTSSGAEDVRLGRISGFMHALSAVQTMVDELGMNQFTSVPVPKEIFSAPIGGFSTDQEIINRFNTFLLGLTNDGSLVEIQDRWFGKQRDLNLPLPEIPNTGQNGKILVAICSDSMPYVFATINGEYSGYSIELVLRFGAYEGKKIEFIDMEFGGLIPYILSKKAEIGFANVAITEERKKSVYFTDAIFDEQHGIFTLRPSQSLSTPTQNTLRPDKQDNQSSKIDLVSLFANQTLGCTIGAISDNIIQTHFHQIPKYYTDIATGLEDVRKNRIEGFMADYSTLKLIALMPENHQFVAYELPKSMHMGHKGGFSKNPAIIDQFNQFLAEIENNGLLHEMQVRWLENAADSETPMPNIPSTGTEELRIVTCLDRIPFSFLGANNTEKGYSIELALRFGAYLGRPVKFYDVEFSAMIPFIISEKADLGLANVSITEERKKSVLFTNPICDDPLGIIALQKKPNEIVIPPASGLNPQGDEHEVISLFSHKILGCALGSVNDVLIQTYFSQVPKYYSDMTSGFEDVRRGRIDGYITDLSVLRIFTALPENHNFTIYPIPQSLHNAPMGAFSKNQEIINQFNLFISSIEADGTLKEMQARWLENVPDLDTPMPVIPTHGTQELRVATCLERLPFSYRGENNTEKGYSVEMALRFGSFLGRPVKFYDMEFSAMIPFVVSERADLGIANVSITEERKKSILFTNPIFYDQSAILAYKEESFEVSETNISYLSFRDKRIGVGTGSIAVDVISGPLHAIPVIYDEVAVAIEDARLGRIDGFIWDLSATQTYIATSQNQKEMVSVEIPPSIFMLPMGAISMNQELITSFNLFLQEIKKNGVFEEMQTRWLSATSDMNAPVQDFAFSGDPVPAKFLKGEAVLKVATTGNEAPFAFFGVNGLIRGYSIELMQRFAQKERLRIEFHDMNFGGLIPYIKSNKADIGISNMSITEERQKSVLFSDTIFDDQLGILIRNPEYVQAKRVPSSRVWGWIKTGIQRNLITDNRWKMIVDGLGVTMIISLFAQLFGTVLGGFICYLLERKNRFIKWLGNFYCGLINGTPMVVLLMITYYIIFGSTKLSNVFVAVMAFTMMTGAGIAQILHGAIETIDIVEIEAARSIGFSAFRTFKKITLPQAIKRALPSYTKNFVELVKATAIVGYIAIQDLTRAGDIIRSRTYDAYFPLLFVAIIYLVVTSICVLIFKYIVKKINKGGSQ